MENRDRTRIYALKLLKKLSKGTRKYNKLCKRDIFFKNDMYFLKKRLNQIIDEEEITEDDEIYLENDKFIVEFYHSGVVFYGNGYGDWEHKVSKTTYEIYNNLSKIDIETEYVSKEYEIKSKKLRK